MPHPVTWFEITGNDSNKLLSFYKSVFDWKVESAPMPDGSSYHMVAGEEGGIGGGISQGPGGGHVTVYVEVDDPDAYLKKVEAAGGRTLVPTTDVPDMVTFALFADPEGHMIGLVKRR